MGKVPLKWRTSATRASTCSRKTAGRSSESHAELRVSMGVNTPLADKAQHVETFRPGKCRRSSLAEAPIPIARRRMRSDWWFQATRRSAGMTQTYYKAFAPRIGISWSPGNSAKTSIRAGWDFSITNRTTSAGTIRRGAAVWREHTLSETQFNQPFLDQSGTFVT